MEPAQLLRRLGRAAGVAALCLPAALLAPGCTSPDERIAPFADRWGAADFAAAEGVIDELLADEAGVPAQLVTDTRGLADEIAPGAGDTFLFMLEKAMTRLAAGDTDATIDLLRRARDVLADRYEDSDLESWLATGVADDTFLAYRGADYEHVLTPALLALVDLLEGGQDAYAYALQVGEVQERILGSTFGENVDGKGHGYNPRKQYSRVAVGAYVAGLVRERESFTSEASVAYRRARDWGGEVPLLAEACERTEHGVYAPPHHGVVHVFRFAGRGPRLVQGTSPLTDGALFLANIASIAIGRNVGLLGQMSIPVPVVHLHDTAVPELELRVGGQVLGVTSTLLDVNAVAVQQRDANLNWILARAAIRRGIKAFAAHAAQETVTRKGHDKDGTALLAGMLANLTLTAGENADTRQWTSLPARLQAGRLALPEGTHTLELGGGTFATVRVAAGKDSYVLIVQPNLAVPGAVLTDVYSRPAELPAPQL